MNYIRLLLLSFVTSLLSLSVHADDYALYVGGRQVSGGSSTFNVTADGKIKYDPTTKTLTLSNAVIRDTVCAIHNEGIDGLTILVEGTDSIFTTAADALLLERQTFIRSTSHEGQLCVNVSKKNKKDSIADYAALRVIGGSALRISDCYVKMASEGWAVKGDSNSSLDIVTAEVTAQTKDTLRSCIESLKGLTFRSVIATGGEAYDTKSMSLHLPNSIKKAQQVLIQGSLYLGRYIVDVQRTDTVQTIAHSSTGLMKGRIKYDGRSHVLTLDSSVVRTTGCPAIRNENVGRMTIAVIGPNTINTTGSNVFSLHTSTSIIGAGNAGGQLIVKGNAGGIYQGGDPNYGYTLTLSGLVVEVDAATQGIYGDGMNSYLAIDNARVRVYSSSAVGSFRAVAAFAGCAMGNVDCANGAAWRHATGSFDRNDGTTAREVRIDVPTTIYPIAILGHNLNNLNCADIAIDGLTGTGSISYNAATKTLSLSDIAIHKVPYQGYNQSGAIYINEPGFTIHVSGANSIVHDSGIVAMSGGTLTGPGTLSIEATGESAIYTASKDMFTVACAMLNAKGTTYGFIDTVGGGLTLTASDRQTATTHTFYGGYKSISTPNLTLNGMNFFSPVCCYFDPEAKCIRQNGGREVTEEVTFRQVTQRYGVRIMGVEIDNCNTQGVGSPYISTTQFMNFNEANKTLTLDNFSLTTDAETNIIESECDGLQIVVNGDCKFNTTAAAFFKVNNPKKTGRVDNTFRGNGTIEATARYFTMLVGTRAGITFTDNITVTGQGAISGNSLGKNDESITVEGNASITCKGSEGNPSMDQLTSIKTSGNIRIVEPNWGTSKLFNNGYGIADRQGEVYKGQVIIAKPKSFGMYIGEDAVTNANYSDVDKSGQFTYEPDRSLLTLRNVSFNDTTGLIGGGIDNREIEGLTINIVGDNNIRVRNHVIYSERNFSIIGSGTLNGTSTEGIALWLFGSNCGIRGPQLNLTGGTYAIQGAKRNEKLMVYDTQTKLTLRGYDRGTVSGLDQLQLQSGLYITEPYGAEFSTDYGGIAIGGLLYRGTVVISNREPSAIDDPVASPSDAPIAIYDQGGRKLQQQQRGLNIVRMSDGTVRKIMKQ